MAFRQAHAQQTETTELAQTKISAYFQNIQQTGGDLQNRVVTRIDSLSNKLAMLLQTTTDSLNNLPSAVQEKIQSNLPSLFGHM